ncbi:hypothetical protein ACMFMG_004835 [Clarireedia jacksonii]
MAERLGRSTSDRNFHRRKPEDMYVETSKKHAPQATYTAPNEIMFIPDMLVDDKPDSVTFSVRCSPVPFGRSPGIQSTISSPRNFFLEKPPANYYRNEASPISPGVTVLLSPASYDEDGSDVDAMDFFQAATYQGPQTLQIVAEKTRASPQPIGATKRTVKAALPSPITPKAWPCVVEPDISTLPSLKDRRAALEAGRRLDRETSQSKKAPATERKQNPPICESSLPRKEASRTMQTRPVTRSRTPSSKQSKSSTDAGRRRSQSFSAQQRGLLVASTQTPSVSPVIPRRGSPSSESWKRRSLLFDSQQQSQFLMIRQQSRSPSNESDSSTSSGSRRYNKRPPSPSDHSSSISRTPSPVFDDEDNITDFESVTDMDEDYDDDGFYGCDKTIEVLTAHGSERKEQPTFCFQQEIHIEPQSKSPLHDQPLRNHAKPLRSPDGSPLTLKNTLPRARFAHKISSESMGHSPADPPPLRRSPPPIPIHRDEVKVSGASFVPSESRTPRTVVANWLAGISISAGRNETARENDVKKPRKWGRKARQQPENWI